MKKIGFLGGTFNPIHLGHLLLGEWAKEVADLDEIWIIPSGISYLKRDQKILSGEERISLIECAIQNRKDFKCCDIEVKRNGNTYTYETLQELKSQYPSYEFYFITGADCLFSIENWKNPEEIFKLCTLLAATREQTSMEEMERKKKELEEKFDAKIMLFQFMNLEVSSTMIRERIREGKSVRYLLPDIELEYIKEKGYYRDESEGFTKA